METLPLLTIHITGVFITLAIVVFSDFYGLLWLLGKKETLSIVLLKRLHLLVWIGLGVTVLAGIGLFIPLKAYLLTVPAFWIKIIFVVMLAVNAVFIEKHMQIASERPYISLTKKEKTALIASGLVSVTGWIGAFIAAQFLNV